MKIAFTEDLTRQDSGKHKFLHRLSKELATRDNIKIVKKNADILLHLGRNMDKINTRKRVMRLDGLWFNKDDSSTEKKNNTIRKYMSRSDGLIFQGEFCKTAYVDFFGKDFIGSKPHACITNGAHPGEFLARNPQNFFFAYANWRPHKRLSWIEQSFAYAIKQGLNADLIIAGKCEKKHIPRVQYVGWLNPQQVKEYLSKCIAVIHLSWLDWSPNVISEAIVAGCPVITGNTGGSGELVKDSGVVLKEKEASQWNGRMRYLYKPPDLDIDAFCAALFQLKSHNLLVEREDLFIANVASQYCRFFNKLL